MKNFIRKVEDFICEHCGALVKGTGYTNHCPECLWSKHVDDLPGDRSHPCGGLMEPIGLELRGDKRQIIHRCQKCGIIKKNKVADNDNPDTILGLVENK
ncbi:MAG: RNHCP domain-containing protein [Patescibacteria group bacterium]|jgi:hypothetical protein